MSLSREKRVDRSVMRTMFKVPFFSGAVMKLPVRFDNSIPTAHTDGGSIVWNGDWFDKLQDACLPTVLCHEALHCLLGHLWRYPGPANDADAWRCWNEACDHTVNLMLKEFSAMEMAKNGLSDPFPFPDPQDAYLADPKYAGMSEEKIFWSMWRERQKQPGQQGQPGQPGQPGGSQPGGQGQPGQQPGQQPGGQGSPKPGKQPSGPAGPHSMPSFGQMQQPQNQPGNGKADEAKQLQNDWEATLIQAASIGKGQGTMPAGFERLVDKEINPKVPWQQLLRSFLREQAYDDWDFQHPAMEYEGSDFIMPSMRSERVGRVVFATDTSGSIDNDLLAVFQGEKQQCFDDLRPKSLLDIYCDTKVHKAKEYTPGDTLEKQAPGGGGTSFVPVFEHCDKLDQQPKALVYLTDLDGRFPAQAPNYPVIWVTWTKGATAPFGEVVYVGDE